MAEENDKSFKVDNQNVTIEQNLTDVYKRCVMAGISQSEIYEMSKPLRDLVHCKEQKSKKKKIVVFIAILVCMWSAANIDWSPLVLSFYGRYALISLLPYWDWTKYYYQTCLIENPHYEPRRLYEDDCDICDSLSGVAKKLTITHTDLTEDYLKNDVPIVLENSLGSWDVANGAFSIYNISKMLTDADPNGDALPCAFTTNLRLRGENYFKVFLSKLRNEEIKEKSWYTHWENCDKLAAKAVRQNCPRPDFLPPMIDNSEPNWILMSANYQARSYKPLQLLSDMMWLSQLEGNNDIRLIPRSPCNKTCLELDHHLTSGQTVMFTNRLWQLHYLPGKNGINIAIGGGGSFYNF